MFSVGGGLAGFGQGYQQNQDAVLRRRIQQQQLELAQQQNRERQQDRSQTQAGEGLAYSALLGMGGQGQGAPQGSLSGMASRPDYSPPQPAPAPPSAASYDPGGSGSSQLAALVQQVSGSVLPPGYRAVVTSGDRPGATVAGTGGQSQHALGNAIDVQIIGPQGPIPNKGPDTTGLYGKLAVGMRQAANPAMAPKMAWGGNFTTGAPDGPRDLMHFDLGGDRGKFGSLAAEAGQQAKSTAVQAAQTMPMGSYGRSSMQEAAAAIERTNPDAPPAVKFLALQQMSKLLAPDERAQLQMLMLQNREQFQIELMGMRNQNQIEMQNMRNQAKPEPQGQIFVGADGKPYSIRGSTASPIQGVPDAPQGTAALTRPGSAGTGGPVSQASVDFWTKVIKSGGAFPPGFARSSSPLMKKVMENIGETGDSGKYIEGRATVAADAGSLRNMTKMADAATSFERTASQNFDLALKLSKDAVPTEWGPWLNRWVESGQTQFGNEQVPAYVTAMLTAANEYAKIMSGSTGAQGSTVDSRREAAELFSPYLSNGQIERVVAVAKADMANRKASLYGQVDDIKGRLKSSGSGEPTATQGQPSPSPAPKAPAPADDVAPLKYDAQGNRVQ
jgi:hypothetical protein